jgi:hypothetical protein
MHAFHPYGALQVVVVQFCFSKTNMDYQKTQRLAKAIKISPAMELTVAANMGQLRN